MEEEPRHRHPPGPDAQRENSFRSQLSRIGDCRSIRRLIGKYGNIRTKTILLSSSILTPR